MPHLLDPIRVGDLDLPNRVFMAPLTRSRASEGRVPNDLMRDYYVQRAEAGLILSEATSVTPMGVGYPDTPGIWSDEQVEGWKGITKAVHEAGGRIFLQLWHVGRISDPVYLNGELPVAPSAIAPGGIVSRVQPPHPYVTPRALERDEIPGVIEAYRQGAINAQKAGFDGVEVHGANGYLLQQFLHLASNQRNDDYGGSLENRARLMLEVTDACIEVWGKDRVGMHLAPRGGGPEEDAVETFGYVARELRKREIAFVCAREEQHNDWVSRTIRQEFGGVFVANEKFDFESGESAVAKGEADAVAYGRLYIANPDLVRRFREKTVLNPWDSETFYTPGPKGYIDYPALA
ncbi:alkene reductase [bacterium]|nr:MAG: alkene reductase [bacterium]